MADTTCRRCKGRITGDDLGGLEVDELLVGEGIHRHCLELAEEIAECERRANEAERAGRSFIRQAIAAWREARKERKRLKVLYERQERLRAASPPSEEGAG